MEYGIWGLHAAGGLWGDPRLARRHRPILQSGTAAPGILPIIAFGAHSQPPHPVLSQWQNYEGAMELTVKKSSTVTWSDEDDTEHQRDDNSVGKWRNDGSADECSTFVRTVVQRSMTNDKKDDKTMDKVTNEKGSCEKEEEEEEEEEEEDEETEEEEEEDCNDQRSRQASLVGSICNNQRESDDENEGSGSRQSANNNFSKLIPTDPMSRLIGFDKEENVSPVLNNWVLGAYTAMIGRLTAAAAAAALEANHVPMMVSSNSDSESESSSSSSTSVASSSLSSGASSRLGSKVATATPGSHRGGYSCGTCDTVVATRAALRKHIIEAHRGSLAMQTGSSTCPSTGCEFTSNSGCEMESHVAAHVARVTPTTAKKSSLALQRVRYRYEREEYRCSLCSYACTIEKAFQRHLRAHARGNATPETRVSCAVCGADRSSEVDLSRHMRRHRDDRYFCCDICVFRTVQLKKLIQHRRMHTGEKPHLCPHCAYRSARRDNLRSHVRRVHKKENLYCDTFSPRGMLVERFPSQGLAACTVADTSVTSRSLAISLSPPSSPPPTSTPPSSVNDGVDG